MAEETAKSKLKVLEDRFGLHSCRFFDLPDDILESLTQEQLNCLCEQLESKIDEFGSEKWNEGYDQCEFNNWD